MKKFLFYVVNICLIVSLLIPSGLVEGMMNLEAGPGTNSGLYRTYVTIDQPYDLTRLQDLGIKILDQESDWASVLVSDVQLENLARLGFEPQASNELSLLVLANAESNSWLASSLSAQLDQAISFTNSVENAQINGIEADDSTLVGIIEGFSVEQLSGIQALPGVDNDADGLTDTQESWWCTDPMNPDSDGDGALDGTEVLYLKDWVGNRGSGVPASGKPFAGWPSDYLNCYDDDYDSIPDMAERWELGLNMNRESTDGDKFDDGQELFGITKYPNYGALPRPEDTFITSSMPGWVDPPGNSPVVAAYPVISFKVFAPSIEITLVSEIIAGETHGSGETFGYLTTQTDGTNMGVGNAESHVYSDWQEIGNSQADTYERSHYESFMESRSQQYVREVREGLKVEKELNGNAQVTLGGTYSIGTEVSADLDVGKALAGAIAGGGVGALSGLGVGASLSQEAGVSAEFTFGASGSERTTTTKQTRTVNAGGYEISREVGDTFTVGAILEQSQTTGVGYESGQTTTITRETYDAFSVSNDHQIATTEQWNNATAVNSNHAADLTFTYQIANSGSDNANLIDQILFNLFIEGEKNPISVYAGVMSSIGSCTPLTVNNLYPGETYPSNGLVTQCAVPLTLDQLAKLDQGVSVRIVVADYYYGDDEDFYHNAWSQGVLIEVDDDTWDGDEEIDSYLIPTWGVETYQEVIRRYFRGRENEYGDLSSIISPEFDANHEIIEWNEFAIGNTTWWSIYMSDDGDEGDIRFRRRIAIPETKLLLRLNSDSDLDSFSDRVERETGTDLSNADEHPNASLVAGYYMTRVGNQVEVQLSIQNYGSFDAFSIEGKMFALDETVTIESYLVGMGGYLPSGSKVKLTSKVLQPVILQKDGTASPSSSGFFVGTSDTTITFTATGTGEVGITTDLMLEWSSSAGPTGLVNVGSSYLPQARIPIVDGIEIKLSSGSLTQGDSFAVSALVPQDVFRFTINQEPYTMPEIVITYNDPSGKKSISSPFQLSSIHDDLSQYIGSVNNAPELIINSETGFNESETNQISVTLLNPQDETIRDAQVIIAYAEAATGVIVAGRDIYSDLLPGPNIFFDSFSVDEFDPPYDPSKEYKVKVYATDRQGIVIDIAYVKFNQFGGNDVPSLELSNMEINLGNIRQGAVVDFEAVASNTGTSTLLLWHGLGDPFQVIEDSSLRYVEPGEMVIIPLSLDTSLILPGQFSSQLTLRTNDPSNSTVNLMIIGNIIEPTETVTVIADPYLPLNELLYVNGPIAANSITRYSNAAEVNSGAEPIAFTDEYGTILGKGEQFVGLDDGLIAQKLPTPNDSTAESLDLTGAIELEEYRTDFSRVYVWPDGRGVIIPNSFGTTDGNQLNDSASSGRYYDTYVNSTYPNTVTWDQAALYLGNFSAASKTDARILLWFHLPTLPQYAVIDSAYAELTAYTDQASDTINTRVFRITGSWSQTSTSPTWNNHPPVDWGTVWSSLPIAKTTGPKTWDVTALTTAWYSGTPNYGMVIQANPQNANGVVFRSAESGINVPQLTVNFHIPPPPSAPTLYAISNADGDGAYSVDWSDVVNTTSYNLEESFNSGAWNLIMNTASSIYNASGRSAGNWCYRVKANNAYGSSGWSASQCTTVNPPPGTPAISTIDNADGDGSYLVDWNDVPLATSYELQENHDAGAFTTVYSGATSGSTISGRSSGQWCYRVKAINPSGSGGWSSTQCAMVNTPPNVPAPLLPIDDASLLGRAVSFSWQASSDPDNFPGTPMKYHVEVTPAQGGVPQVSDWTTNTQITVVLPEDGEYSWRVEASDNISSSGWSPSRNLSVFSIERANADQVRIALPESVVTFANYKVLYGLPASFPTAITPTMVYLELPKRLYSSITLGVLVNESINQNATFTLDIAADGSIEWSQNIVWNSPTFFESPDLTAAINGYMSQSSVAGGELVSIPISVNFSSIGELFITGIEAHTGVDSDPQLGTGDLMISNIDPMETDVISLTARVHNGGIFTAKNIMVNFFAGDPAYGGRYIGSRLVSNILAGSYGDAVLNWDTSGYVGDIEIFAIVDYSAQIPEMDETNNTTSQSLTIRNRPDLTVTLISLSDNEPMVGESVTLTVSETNLGESDAASSLVSVYIGDTVDNGILLGENFVEVMRGSTTNVNFTWVPDRTGWHRIYVLSDANDQIFEYDESNNQNWLDVYIGLAGPLLLDSGTNLDPIYTVETGYGYIDINQPDELVSCSVNNLPDETLRRDPDGTIVYKFDHLLPGHFYHLDITLFECDGAGRQETVLVDGNKISEVEDLGDGQVHRLSMRLDPALYGDRTISVEIQAEGIDGAVVSEVNLHDIDYRYADAGGSRDPQYPGDEGYGWIDGSSVLTWGALPYQSVRVDQSDNSLSYQFDNLSPTKLYNVHFTFWQPSGTGRIQKVQVDGIDTGLSINTGDYLRHQETIAIPLSAYSSDGRVVISIVRTNATSGAMVNEIALEEETVFTNTSCIVQPTPYFSETYGSLLISGADAPVGSVVQAFNPRGDTVGCFTVTDEGLYGFMRIYGEDPSAVPTIPGMRNGEIVSYSVNGAPAVATPLFYWSDDHAVHNVNLNAGNVSGQSILLQPGWNLMSFNVEPPAPMVSSVLQSVASRYDRVLGEHGIYVPSLPPEFNTLKELHSANGYYLRVTGTTSVSLLVEGIAQACSEPKLLHVGWNWIGAPCEVTETATALLSIEGHYQRVLSINKTYDPALPTFSTLKSLIPGEGYLIYMIDPATLIYPDVALNLDKVNEAAEDSCRWVSATPFSTLVYGYLHINTDLAAEGSLVEFITPRGELAGCSLVAADGILPLTQIYGMDGENIGGFLEGEEIFVRVDGIAVGGPLDFTWQDDKTPHELSITITIHKVRLPLIVH